jgi:predicted Na+-dependent transporter
MSRTNLLHHPSADLALSVTMTAISTLASVILMPANLLLYCKFSYEADVVQSLDFNSLFIALTVVISAIGLGLFASAKIHSYRFNIFANKVYYIWCLLLPILDLIPSNVLIHSSTQIGNYAGVSLVAFSALMSNTQGDTQIWEHTWQFYVAVMIPLLAALLIANALTSLLKMEKPERVTLAVECCYQNVGIATSVALTMFKGDELGDAMAVPLFYGFMEAFVLGIYCIITWKAGWTKAPSNVSFWTMIGTSYEVLLIEHSDLKAVEVSLPKNQKDMIEKKNRTGDTIYMKYNLEEGEEEEPMTFGCIHIPSHPKEASGFNLPEVPGEEREDGIHQTEFATKQGGVEC